ncbi:MAG TPA: hypothetical protein VFB31_18550 [Pseudolabrys sp.]|nr:hypothetical protein [Pseudolabrys sp.]
MTAQVQTRGECRSCRHFRNDAAFIEQTFGGLTSLSSGYGSVRSDDGICLHHERYLSARSSCGDFSPQPMPVEAGQAERM